MPDDVLNEQLTQRLAEYRLTLEDEFEQVLVLQSKWHELAVLARDIQQWGRRIEALAERYAREGL